MECQIEGSPPTSVESAVRKKNVRQGATDATRRDATHHVARVDVGMIIGTDQPDHLVDCQAVQQVGEAIGDGKLRVTEGQMVRYISWKASPDVSVRQARAWIGRRDGEQRERDEAGKHFLPLGCRASLGTQLGRRPMGIHCQEHLAVRSGQPPS